MNNVMLDLETMGTGVDAPIIAIGACFFEPYTGKIGDTFHSVVSLESSSKKGKIDASTVLWWFKQSDEARAVFDCDEAISLEKALVNFSQWISEIKEFKERHVWGNGSTFDNIILGNSFDACEISRPWPWFGDRDVRTVVDIGRSIINFDPKKDMPFDGVRHNAMHDAVHQAKYVSAILRKLNGKDA